MFPISIGFYLNSIENIFIIFTLNHLNVTLSKSYSFLIYSHMPIPGTIHKRMQWHKVDASKWGYTDFSPISLHPGISTQTLTKRQEEKMWCNWELHLICCFLFIFLTTFVCQSVIYLWSCVFGNTVLGNVKYNYVS